jgi:SAM-dependent methyltransferase
MDEQINREICIHGKEWDTFHEGYFSDTTIACPLIEKIEDAISESCPEVVVDLGGGTGFLLSQILHRGLKKNIRLVDLDCSDAQLEIARSRGLHVLKGSIDSFTRTDVDKGAQRVLYIMRSVLHYYGKTGLTPVLQHIRGQAREGELFVHQTASFAHNVEAACMNLLYKKMRTLKWYPTVQELSSCLIDTGWSVLSVSPVGALQLSSHDLAKRYNLDTRDVRDICDEIMTEVGEMEKVFSLCEGGFCAYLHYRIYVCAAAPLL